MRDVALRALDTARSRGASYADVRIVHFRAQNVAVVMLTRKPPEMASINSLVSLRAVAEWSAREGGYACRGGAPRFTSI